MKILLLDISQNEMQYGKVWIRSILYIIKQTITYNLKTLKMYFAFLLKSVF